MRKAKAGIPWAAISIVVSIILAALAVSRQMGKIEAKVDVLYDLEMARHPREGPTR